MVLAFILVLIPANKNHVLTNISKPVILVTSGVVLVTIILVFFNLTPIFENFTRYAAISLLFSLLATLLVIDLVDYFKKRATKKGKQLRNKYFININSPLQLFFIQN
ncbi:MAG TPA: hypothetical protein DHV18_10095 [Brochothrix thermosphacta]|nr:hypothetical protein [Brochothrix thermosphacta]HCZ46320.1 hypothetical protein [Brochothrix thermosphacta]